MPKNDVSSWDTAAANNTDVGGVDLAENSMRPRDVNNAIRTMMAQIATFIGSKFSPASSTSAAYLDLHEDTDNGTNRVRLIAPTSVASDRVLTLPDATDTLVGTVSPTFTGTLTAATIAATGLSVTSASAFQPQVAVRNNANDANSAYFMVRKSRGVSDTAVQASDTLGTFMFQGYDSTGTPVLRNGAYLTAIVESVSAGAMAARFELVAGSSIWQFKTDNNTTLPGGLSRGVPVTKTGDFTVATTESWLINNKGSACVATLPAAASFPGRELFFTNIGGAFALTSASSNVVPKAGGAAGTAILAATDGVWATLVSDGTNWLIMQAGT
jgi:hypothetical protein